MKTFIRTWALASAGFLLLELASRPPRRPLMNDRAAEAIADLMLLDAELRGHAAPVRVPPHQDVRRLCLCGCAS